MFSQVMYFTDLSSQEVNKFKPCSCSNQIERNKFVVECQEYRMETSEANLNNLRSEIGKMSPVQDGHFSNYFQYYKH